MEEPRDLQYLQAELFSFFNSPRPERFSFISIGLERVIVIVHGRAQQSSKKCCMSTCLCRRSWRALTHIFAVFLLKRRRTGALTGFIMRVGLKGTTLAANYRSPVGSRQLYGVGTLSKATFVIKYLKRRDHWLV